MSDALRRVMLAAEGAGELGGGGVQSGRASHPVCGDEVAVDVRLSGDIVEELAWRARGCPACVAVAAAAPEALRGAARGEAPELLRGRLDQLGGLARHERHAERIFLEALAQACGTSPAESS